MNSDRRCTARSSRTGERCKRYATKGATVCATHGARAPQVRQAAEARVERERAERAVVLYGLSREIEPHEALLEEVHRTAGHVAWLGEVVRGLEQKQLTHGVTRSVQLPDGSRTVEARAVISGWLKLYQDERDRLVRVAKAAIEAGVQERAVRIVEEEAQQIAQVVSAILGDLGHDLADPKVRETVRLRLIEGGKHEAAIGRDRR